MLKAVIIPLLATLLSGDALAAAVVDPLQRPALAAAVAERSVFLDIERAGERLIAVGERGLILLSDDEGERWRQAEVPVAVTLTAVDFVSASHGWAVGHSGVVLHSRDGGETWSKQLDGNQAAALAMREAQQAAAANPEDKEMQQYLGAAKWLVSDGADKPFLDVHFFDEQNGILVGAYGLLFSSDDGGDNWSSRITGSANPLGMNLYATGTVDGVLYVAGEQGYFAASRDGGASFERIDTPYQGTWFVLATTTDGRLFLGGLRGNAYRYDPAGGVFSAVNITSGVSFNSALALDDGRLLFVDQAGRILLSRDNGESVHFYQRPPGAPLVVLAEHGRDDRVTGGGFGGLAQIPLKPANEVNKHD
jgi:photosystem II stability/assembly factor-like uncharacterized protein